MYKLNRREAERINTHPPLHHWCHCGKLNFRKENTSWSCAFNQWFILSQPLVTNMNVWAQGYMSGSEEKAHYFIHTVNTRRYGPIMDGKLGLGRIKCLFRRQSIFWTQYPVLLFLVSIPLFFPLCCYTNFGQAPPMPDSYKIEPMLWDPASSFSSLPFQSSPLRSRSLSQVHFSIFSWKSESESFL